MLSVFTRGQRWALANLALLTLAGAILRLWQIRESLWLDELHTAWCAGGSLADVAPRAVMGNQSPLFFWLEWFVVHVLGSSELTLRLPSLFAGCMLPVALFLVVQRWTTFSGLGLLAAALAVIDPTCIFYSTEARPYALVELLAVIHVAVFAELIQRPTWELRAAFVGGAALLIHLHYTAALLIVAENCYWLFMLGKRGSALPYGWHLMVIDLSVLALLILPASGILLEIAHRRDNWAAFVPQRRIAEIVQSLWTNPVRGSALLDAEIWQFLNSLPWSICCLYVATDLVVRRWLKARASHAVDPIVSDHAAALSLCWLLVPLAIAWLATATGWARLYLPRYVLVAAPAAMVLAAMQAGLAPGKWGRVIVASALLVAGVWTSGIPWRLGDENRVIDSRGEDWRSAVEFLNQEFATKEPVPVLLRSGLIEDNALRESPDEALIEYCLFPLQSLYRINVDPDLLIPLPSRDSGRLLPETLKMIFGHRGAWLVVRGSNRTATLIERQVTESAAGGGKSLRVMERHSFGRIHVSRFAVVVVAD
jgi:hypothetical protein